MEFKTSGLNVLVVVYKVMHVNLKCKSFPLQISNPLTMTALSITNLLARLRMDILVLESHRRSYLFELSYRGKNVSIFFYLLQKNTKHKINKTPQTLQLIVESKCTFKLLWLLQDICQLRFSHCQ